MSTLDFEHKVEVLEKSIKEHDQISETNKELLLKMKRDFSLDGLSAAWQQNMLSRLKKMASMAEFNFDEANEDNLKDLIEKVQKRDISERTVVNYKGAIKRFYKWLNDGEYPELVEWINTTYNERNNTLPEDILTEDDIFELIDNAKTARDKAIIALLWESGARIGELIDLKVKDLRDHENGYQVVINGKTGSRRLPLISSVPYLNNWLNNHPNRERDSYLWSKIRDASGDDRISYRYLRKMLEKTKERSDIEKPVNPHHFRHSRATYLANRFTEAQLCEWFGWVQGSDVPAKYVHMSGRDIDGAYAQLHGKEKEEESDKSKMAPKDCPRCETSVEPNADFCYNCGQALSSEAIQQIREDKEEVSKDFTEFAKKHPDLLDDMDDFMEMIKLVRENKEVLKDLENQLEK